MMEAYQGYSENGVIIPFGNPKIPDNRKEIITVLDESEPESRAARQRKAMNEIWSELDDSEPLGSEFDEILNPRVNITRERDL